MVRYHEWNIHCQTLIIQLMEASEHIYDEIFSNDEHNFKERKEEYEKSIAYSKLKIRNFRNKCVGLQNELCIDLHPALAQILTAHHKDSSKEAV